MDSIILTKEELNKFQSVPVIKYGYKKTFFTIPDDLLEQIHSAYNIENISLIITLYSYFKHSHQFFTLDKNDTNLNYVQELYKLPESFVNLSSRTIYSYKKFIKSHLGIQEYTPQIEQKLQSHAIDLASNFIDRKKIFYELVRLSKKLNIEIPNYTTLSKIISNALSHQKKDIIEQLKCCSSDKHLDILEQFLNKDNDFKNKYNLNRFKKLEHSTNKKQMVSSLHYLETIKSKFNILLPTIDKIGITEKVAKFYATWIQKSKMIQITRKNKIEIRFYLLCFIYHQYHIRNDNLIDRFIATVQSAKNSSIRAQKDFSFVNDPKKNRLLNSFENSTLSTLNEINSVLYDTKLSDHNKIEQIQKLMKTKAQELENVLETKKQLEKTSFNKYAVIEQKSRSLQGKLSGILKLIEFDESSSQRNLIDAINYFRDNDGNINKNAPVNFLDEEEKKVIYDGDKVKISLYKIILFFHVSDGIKSGILNLKHSYKYKNFEKYLINQDEWGKNKKQLLKTHELEHLKDFDQFFKPIKEKLEMSFKTTNNRINTELNSYFRFKDDTFNSFVLTTPKIEKDDENILTLSQYLPQSEYISIIDLLHSVDSHSNFLESLKHYTQIGTSGRIDKNLLLASILGYGCNITLSKMGKISKGISKTKLDNTKIWYFNEENTIKANDKIIEFLEQLEIVKLLRKHQEFNHTSSDGQKFNMKVSVDSTNAGWSHKYFGLNKGVAVYTFIDESHRLFYSVVINVSERESGSVIDGLMHNETVKSDIHSTDTHGFSEVIFGITNLLGFSFAPRIKNFKDQQLYGCDTPKAYQTLGYKLLPKRKIKENLINEYWDQILRFIVTVKSRKTTASQLLKRLTSYSKQHKLYRALKEFGKVIKTDFLLNYIDDVELRQRIEKQLNKVEASNRFSKAVFFGSNSEFQFATQEEQNIANNCKRLIQNAIILWNYLYITKKLQQAKSTTQKDEIIKAIENSSIVHWSHVNFYGEYDFTRRSKKIKALTAVDLTKGFIQPLGQKV